MKNKLKRPNKNLKTWHAILLITKLVFLLLLVTLIYNEIENEKKTKAYLSSISQNQKLLKELNTVKFNLVKSQDHLLNYMLSNNTNEVKEYFGIMQNSQQTLDTLYTQNLPNLTLPTATTSPQDSLSFNSSSLKDSLAAASQEVLSKLLKSKIQENQYYNRLNFDKMGVKTTIQTTRKIDSVKKQGFFKRLGKALKNENETQKEEVTHTIIVEYDNDKIIGSLEDQFKTLLNKANKHYQREIYKINSNYRKIKQKKLHLLKINSKIQKMSKQLLADYETSLKEQNQILDKKYNLQYLKNREKRFYLLLALAIVLVLLAIILSLLTRLTYKYEDYLVHNTMLINNNLKIKNKMVSMISHDIRAPLKIISLYIQQLLNIETDSQKREMYNSIDYTTNSAFLLASRILSYLKNEKVQKTDKPIKLDLFSEINNILHGFVRLAEIRNNAIDNTNKIPENTIVYFDKQKLQRLFFNLLGNAIQYTEGGTIYVTSEYSEPTPDIFRFDLTVKDTGVGIEENQIENIFSPFKQMTSSSPNNIPIGVGLGLSLCKEIVEQYNGEITIKSKLNEGTTVHLYVTYPKKKPNL